VESGVSMKAALAVILAIMAACLIVTSAQSVSGYQDVSGEYGRNALSSLESNDSSEQSTQNDSSSNNGLWSWGNVPKGSILVDGKLADDPLNSMNSLNLSDGAITVAGVDTFTGKTIYSYKVSKTGEVKYFYIDPLTQDAVYTDSPNIESEPKNVTGEKTYTLPAIFR